MSFNYRNTHVHSYVLKCIQIGDEEEFAQRLGCDGNELVKVVSIFGNTGDGKSFTLNHTFFGGKEIFKTSAHQSSCTIGVWAAFDPKEKVIVIDTEGLLGITSNQNQRMRLLLKILGISDIMIYRTRAERLHNDMYQFLCESSSAYTKHFSEELEATAKRCNKCVGDLTPAVIVFQETVNTSVLTNSGKTHLCYMHCKWICTTSFCSSSIFFALGLIVYLHICVEKCCAYTLHLL